MSTQFALTPSDYAERAISPMIEMGAYEALWLEEKTTFKTLADRFRDNAGALPSDFVSLEKAMQCAHEVRNAMHAHGITDFGVRVHGAGEYPEKLRDARHPIELLYYRGWWDLVETSCVAVVGTRNPSDEGKTNAERIARLLVRDQFTVVSGLAQGIDTIAHTTAINCQGRTIAVIGTPLCKYYPAKNRLLQDKIGSEFLVISQVPLLRYLWAKNPTANSYFFPERNVTMSALTSATIIVEAGDTSGTLYQAQAAIDQGRKLFILDSCFRKGLDWPQKFEAKGAVRVRDYSDISKVLGVAIVSATHKD